MGDDAALAQLLEMFADAEPSYVARVLAEAKTVEATAERMLATDYPKRVEQPASQPVAARVPKRKNSDVNEKDDDLLAPVGITLGDPVELTMNALAPVFPDCDPQYMRELVTNCKGTVAERSQQVSAMLIEKTYPKRALPPPEVKKPRTAAPVSLDSIMKRDWYKVDNTPVSAYYPLLTLTTLCNRYRRVPKSYIRSVLASHRGRLAPANRQLRIESSAAVPKAFKRIGTRPLERLPDVKDELFEQELYFIEHEEAMEQEMRDHALAEELNKKEYEETGQMIECGCCFSEFTFDDMAQCADGHLFCQECCRRGTKELLGQGKTNLLCFEPGCKFTFPLKEVKKFLDEKTFSWYEKAVQDDELRKADIPNLEKCPGCNFAMIIDNPDERVFKCTQCGKETCRLCKEESHIPLRCNEVEKKEVTSARLLIEQKMTDALVRSCPKCKRRFYKEEGCNHMRCQCGTEICYVCRAVIKGYSHFGVPGGCPQNYDTVQENEAEVEKAAKEAVAAVRREHPELKDDLEKIAQSLVEGYGSKKKKKKSSSHRDPNIAPIPAPPVMWLPPAGHLAAMAQYFWGQM